MNVTMVGINGLGRIGRLFLRQALKNKIRINMINSPGSIESSAHLIQYDSTHGPLKDEVRISGQKIKIGSQTIHYSCERCPENISWKDVSIVLECSGVFKKREDLIQHFKNNVKKIIVAAPAEGADWTVVYGVNHLDYKPLSHHIISNASCTTNCLAPLVYVMDQNFGIEKGYMTTVHAYTSDQKLLDGAHRDLRRARSATLSMIPTTTGATSAIEKILPSLKNKLSGLAIRVPVSNVSLVELVVFCEKNLTRSKIRKAFELFEQKSAVLAIEDKPLVSCDFTGSPYSAILDFDLTKIFQNTAQIWAWYDNEAGYCHRLIDVVRMIKKNG